MLTLVLFAFALRLFRLDFQSLWVDEAISAHVATLSPLQIVADRAANLHAPAYFLFLYAWSALAGRSEFSLRFFSACAGLLFVPLLYWAGRRLFADSRTGLWTAVMGALSAADVIYSQEARMYVMLPAAYLVVLICMLAPQSLHSRRTWIRLATGEAICLYLHPFSVFIVLTVNLWLLTTRAWRANRLTWRRWLVSQALVGASYAPWLLAAWHWSGGLPANLAGPVGQGGQIGLTGFLRLVWSFINTGLVGMEGQEGIMRWLSALALLTLLALPLTLFLDSQRRMLVAMAAAFLIPLLGAYPLWVNSPQSHPRYLLFLLAPLLVASARMWTVLGHRPLTRIVGIAGAGVTLINAAIALRLGLFDPRFSRLDIRSLAAAIAERARPGDAVVMPPADYSLWYYDPAPAEVVNWSGEPGGDQARARQLGAALANRPGAFLVNYRLLYSLDPREQIPFLLEANGRLSERFPLGPMEVAYYQLEPDWTTASPVPVTATCGSLMLTGVYSQASVSSGNAAVVALRWRLLQPTGDDYKASVRLWDGTERLADADVPLLSESGQPTSMWQAGDEAVNYYVLPMPLGTPPLTYTLRVAVYEASTGYLQQWDIGEEWLDLGTVRLLHAGSEASDPYGSWGGVEWLSPFTTDVAPGLVLEGYTLRPAALKPGDVFYVSLRWRASRTGPAHYAPSLVLYQGQNVLAQDDGSLFERYPTENWAAGDLLIETRCLQMPPTLSPLHLGVTFGEQIIPIGIVAVARDVLQWEVPATAQHACARLSDVAELAGYEWEPDAREHGGVLTLYWRALPGTPTTTPYTVFTHLLSPDGTMLAQHDGWPGEGNSRTTTWLPGEVIVDRHELSLNRPYAGPAHLWVGMYDLATMSRLPAYDCAGRRLLHNAIPVTEVDVEEMP